MERAFFFVCDPHRIQTCNLLIRSQMLYSVKLGSHLFSKIVFLDRTFRLVGVAGFEPTTPCSQSRCANRTALHPEFDFEIAVYSISLRSFSKAGAKIGGFILPSKFFCDFFQEKLKKVYFSSFRQSFSQIYIFIYTRKGANLFSICFLRSTHDMCIFRLWKIQYCI